LETAGEVVVVTRWEVVGTTVFWFPCVAGGLVPPEEHPKDTKLKIKIEEIARIKLLLKSLPNLPSSGNFY